MIEGLHTYLLKELESCHRKETAYVVLAVVLSIMELILNFVFTQGLFSYKSKEMNIEEFHIFLISVVMTLVINGILLTVLCCNNQSRKKIKASLSAIYSDHDLDRYADKTPLASSKQNVWPVLLVAALTILAAGLPFLNAVLTH